MKRALLGLAAALALAAALPVIAAPPHPAKERRLLIQVSDGDPRSWALALGNARNVQLALGKDKVRIEIVAYGPGIRMLVADSPASAQVNEALDDGVRLVACENTMQTDHLTRNDMIYGIDYVKTGVVEIMDRVEQGWVYVRP
jgi:intracellular sulfur oxidation DsrE/DsrF family protein